MRDPTVQEKFHFTLKTDTALAAGAAAR
jgi:hypothetical protein